MAVERLLIRRLYGQMIVTLLATWGLSFFLIGLATSVFGNTTRGVSAPLGSVTIGEYRTGLYTIFVIGVAVVVMGGMFALLRYTRAGLIARGTMQDPTMAAALGIDTPWVYTVTFGIGSALTGLAGAVLSPFAGVVPTMGLAYVAKAFITVISGGVAVVAGTSAAAALYGLVNQTVTFLTGPVIGEVALLIAAVILLRIMPQGISGRLFRRTP
jgi:branched-chain amino acid transport system permease protein